MKRLVYADNAATTQMDTKAFEAMKPYLIELYGNASQPYFFSKAAKKALQNSREIIAECIGANPDEIYFTSGGTESDNWVIKSTLFLPENKNEIITSCIEHHAILNSCHTVEKLGIKVRYLSVDRKGTVLSRELNEMASDRTGLVSVMFANNEIGTIEPVAQLAEIAHSKGTIFHTDAVQAVGHVPIDVHQLRIDLLSASAHKFNGPKGIGFLYIKNGTCIHPYEDGGAQERGHRAGTENIASIVGMADALRENISRVDTEIKKLKELEEILVKGLEGSGIDFIRNGAEQHLPGSVSLSFRGIEGEMLLHRLDLMGICVSTGSACDSVNTQVSHVIKAIRVPEEYAEGTIRVTFGKDNTEADAIAILNGLKKIILHKN